MANCVSAKYFSNPRGYFVCFLSFTPGVNSFVTRSIKKMVTSTKGEGKDVELFIVGEKGRSQLARIYADVSSTAIHRHSFSWSCRRPFGMASDEPLRLPG